MSVYNAEKYLNEAIQSILTQTYTNFEFIIINDGSTDGSLEIIQEYMNKDERIVVISRENKGLPYSLNEGIDIAKGKYIARMDADDISLPTRFKEQVEFMENNLDIGVCGSWIKVFGENVKTSTTKRPSEHNELKTRLLFSVCFAHPTVMIRKDILVSNNLKYNLEYVNSQDYELWNRISEVTKMTNIQKVLLKYRISSNSITSITDSSKVKLRYELLSGVFTKVLEQLNIKNTEEENKLHFTIGLNERIPKENIDLKILEIYFNKIIKANKKVNYFDEKYLMKFLSKKFLIVWYFQIRIGNYQILKALASKYLYRATFDMLKDKIIE
jgi:glycosyltransferase involved in cell wall biosynthesis